MTKFAMQPPFTEGAPPQKKEYKCPIQKQQEQISSACSVSVSVIKMGSVTSLSIGLGGSLGFWTADGGTGKVAGFFDRDEDWFGGIGGGQVFCWLDRLSSVNGRRRKKKYN